jgi:plasmid stability protein
MPTLYVENVPDEVYESLRALARAHQNSIAAEVLTLLKENVPTEQELRRRKEALKRALRIRARGAEASGSFPTSEEMQRDDRRR